MSLPFIVFIYKVYVSTPLHIVASKWICYWNHIGVNFYEWTVRQMKGTNWNEMTGRIITKQGLSILHDKDTARSTYALVVWQPSGIIFDFNCQSASFLNCPKSTPAANAISTAISNIEQ